MAQTALRWGILGAGKISHEFVSAVRELPKTNHILQAIACRTKEDAQKFSQVHGFQTIHDSYEALASDPNVDVVYIGTVNSCHFGQAKLCLEKGKNVLVEKPFSLNGKEARELVRIAREKKVFLMEGFWTRFFPAFRHTMKEIEDGKIGTVYQVILTVGNICAHLDRFRLRELGGGSLMNHGVYGIAFATGVFGKPDKVVATGHLSQDQGVDIDTTFVMQYNKGQSAVTVCNSLVKMPGELFYIGTKGTLKIPWPYWCPTVVESSLDGRKEFPLPDLKSSANGTNTIGFVYEAEEVRRCIQQGLLESPEMPLDESVLIYEVCDELRSQLGVAFVQDE